MKFSIIVPAYNRMHTISACIESIYNTNYNDFEVIVIDDGSTDQTLEILQSLVRRFPHMNVVSQKNQGVSVARNKGIELSKGEYILFVDSDDRLAPNALCVLDSYAKNNVDLVMYMARRCRYDTVLSKAQFTSSENDVFLRGTDEIVKWIFFDFKPYERAFYTVWAKAFRRKLIVNKNIRFRHDISLGEDQVFVCQFLQQSNSMCYADTVLYHPTNWSADKRSYGLGSCFRSPKEYLYNQLANYEALVSLYESTGVDEVKEYAVNYILDRPITRILYRHLDEKNTGRVSFLSLWWFLRAHIVPAVRCEFKNDKMLRKPEIAACIERLKKKQYIRLLFEIKKKVNSSK